MANEGIRMSCPSLSNQPIDIILVQCSLCRKPFHSETDEVWQGQIIDGEYICSECLSKIVREEKDNGINER